MQPMIRGLRSVNPLAPLLGAVAGWVAAFDATAGLAAIGAAATAYVVFFGAEVLLLAVVATEPWSGYLLFPSQTFTIAKIVGLLAVASWFLAVATGRAALRYVPQIGWALLFAGAILISLMVSPDPSTGISKTISYVLYVTFLVIFVQLITDRPKVERCLAVWTISAAAAGADGIYLFLTGHVDRVAGPTADANDFAFLLVSALPFAVYFARTRRRFRLAWWLASAVIAIAAIGTLSRGAAVGLVAVLLWGLLTRRIPVPGVLGGAVAVLILLGVAVAFFKPVIDERLVEKSSIANANVASRQSFWAAAWGMAIDHPVFGVGPNRFGAESQYYLRNDPVELASDPYVHNSYLEILAEDGPFALILFIGFLISCGRAARYVYRAARERGDVREAQLANALLMSFLWIVVSGTFISRQTAIPYWLVGGLVASLALTRRQQAARLIGFQPVEDADRATRAAATRG